jgi:hypothetical protein
MVGRLQSTASPINDSEMDGLSPASQTQYKGS